MVVAQRGFLPEITRCSNFPSILIRPNCYEDKFIDSIKTEECDLGDMATDVCVSDSFWHHCDVINGFQKGYIFLNFFGAT